MLTDRLANIIHARLCSSKLVVIPGFGGFVMDAVPAELDELRNRMRPPLRTVIFNSKLVHDDGLLTAAVTQMHESSYSDADTWLTDAISELRFRLKNDGEVVLNGIGTLNMDPSGQVRFKFDGDAALRADAFGLKPISLQPTEKDNVDRVRELIAADGPVATAARTIPLKRVARFAAAAVAVRFLLWIPIRNGMEGTGKLSVQQLNPFKLGSEKVYAPRDYDHNWLGTGLQTPDALANGFEQAYLSVSLTENVEKNIVVRTEAMPTTETERATDPGPSEGNTLMEASSYLVIAAAFAVEADAIHYLADMKRRGFGAQYAGRHGSEHLVAYGSYSSLKDANRMLASVSLSNKKARIISGS